MESKSKPHLVKMLDKLTEENATLIEQNRKLRNELEMLIHLHKTYLIKNEHIERAVQTLKDTENGK